MRIEVTADHIARGVRGTQCSCPVALAVREQTGVMVSVGHLSFSVVGCGRMFPTPPEVRAFVGEYDRLGRRAVGPFAFDLPDGFQAPRGAA